MTLDVTRQDPRYNTLKHGFNLRWPATEAQAAGRIALVEKPDDVVPAIQRIVNAWDCCGTCVGGVLAAHDRATADRVRREEGERIAQAI